MRKKLRYMISHNLMGVEIASDNKQDRHIGRSQNNCSQSRSVTPRFIKVMPAGGNVPRKEGELLKYKNIFTGWGKRYFRLERTYLHYYEHKHNHEPIATITRGEIAEVKPSTAFPEKVNVFEILLKNGTVWYCQASSPTEMVGWMQALSTVPLILDAAKYETVASESFEVLQPSFNPTFPAETCTSRNETASPYQDIHNQAHDIAHTQGYNMCPNSPPPPYSEEDTRPKFPSQHPS